MKSYLPEKKNVKTLGRTAFLQDTLWMAASGSGAEFIFSGKRAAVTVCGDDAASLAEDSVKARIAVYVDGTPVADGLVDGALKTFTAVDGDTVRECRILVVKLSESAMSTCGIVSVDTDEDGRIRPAPDKERLIEFVGDSITCGYGIEDENPEHGFRTETENVVKSYAYKTAQALDADYSMVSFSGYGIISGYTEAKKVPEQTLPQYYRTLGYCPASYRNVCAQETAWDFSGRSPDLIVINLGTNDDSYTSDSPDRQKEFARAYADFLKTVRKCNPHARILCTLGIMGDRLFASVEEAVAVFCEETGDSNIAAMRFEIQQASDGYAADWHPTEATHDKAAKKLTAKIRNLMQWEESVEKRRTK